MFVVLPVLEDFLSNSPSGVINNHQDVSQEGADANGVVLKFDIDHGDSDDNDDEEDDNDD